MTPMDLPEYVRIKVSDIPQEFIDEYDLTNHTCNGWVYFEIAKGCYGLPQSGKLCEVREQKEDPTALASQLEATASATLATWAPRLLGSIS